MRGDVLPEGLRQLFYTPAMPIRILAACFILSTSFVGADAAQRMRQPDQRAAEWARAETDVLLERLLAGGDPEEIRDEANTVLAALATFETAEGTLFGRRGSSAILLPDTAFVARAAAHISEMSPARRGDALTLLADQPELTRSLAFEIEATDDAAGAYSVMLDLVDRFGTRAVVDHASLALALCVVHDEGPIEAMVGDLAARGPSATELFAFFTDRKRRTVWPIGSLRVNALSFVVDAAASLDDLTWAARRAGRKPDISRMYTSVPFDEQHAKRGAPKRVVKRGIGLQNVASAGGVDAEQAHFAAQLGKAVGVPTALVAAETRAGRRVWVARWNGPGRSTAWDFEAAQHAAFEGLRGRVRDPRSKQLVAPEDTNARTSFDDVATVDRERAITAMDMARVVVAAVRPHAEAPALGEGGPGRVSATRRAVHIAANAHDISVTTPGSSALITALLSKDDALVDERREWARRAQRSSELISLEDVEARIALLPSSAERSAAWNQIGFGALIGTRAGRAIFHMAREQVESGDVQGAWQRLERLLNVRTAPANLPLVIDVAELMVEVHPQLRGRVSIEDTLGEAWEEIGRLTGTRGPYTEVSVWYRFGEVYADALDELGESSRARQVRQELARAIR